MSDLEDTDGPTVDTGSDGGDSGTDDEGTAGDDELPTSVVDEAERLTRLARSATDEREREVRLERRDDLLAPHEFTARVRDDDGDAALVLHPAAWHEDGVIRTDRIDDLSRAIEISLEGAEDPDDWTAVDAHNRTLVARVRDRHGDVHGDTASALADFVGNHYAKRIESLTGPELSEFRSEYFVRNAWPSARQRDVVEKSIELVYETAGEPVPEFRNP
ncbi:rnhA operon protein [Natrarchaeobius halalkaliphilus]|uniref:RnhA operon protein n=1 Tax=Natrarchaeobius halalkaliphilus TaxID=1679091 RepID=A0A3N6LPX7_9EURY|nr:rnhA operon protein [Natrarchaeobius halalkaliphilus]RQG91598.1 rnhA operon protein [Natrarchaeobius halalkaliphilus]